MGADIKDEKSVIQINLIASNYLMTKNCLLEIGQVEPPPPPEVHLRTEKIKKLVLTIKTTSIQHNYFFISFRHPAPSHNGYTAIKYSKI